MHNLVANVFKTIAICIIIMAIGDTTLVVADTLSVYNKVNSMANVMQNELARNNCIPDSIEDLFKDQLNSVKEQSKIVSKIDSNIDKKIEVKGKNYESIGESNVKNYGDTQTLAISVDMSPTRIVLTEQGKAGENEGSLLRKGRFTYKLDFIYTVPCLRYLK